MSQIRIKEVSIVDAGTECIVNAANSRLAGGSGVCGAIFREAGWDQMQEACDAIGGCETGSAVLTPAFRIKARYVIHAVGPRWNGGGSGEPRQLYGCYRRSLELAMEKGCHSVAFPLISSGIFGYPKELAWETAIRSCRDFLKDNPAYEMDILFAVIGEGMLKMGRKILEGRTEEG